MWCSTVAALAIVATASANKASGCGYLLQERACPGDAYCDVRSPEYGLCVCKSKSRTFDPDAFACIPGAKLCVKPQVAYHPLADYPPFVECIDAARVCHGSGKPLTAENKPCPEGAVCTKIGKANTCTCSDGLEFVPTPNSDSGYRGVCVYPEQVCSGITNDDGSQALCQDERTDAPAVCTADGVCACGNAGLEFKPYDAANPYIGICREPACQSKTLCISPSNGTGVSVLKCSDDPNASGFDACVCKDATQLPVPSDQYTDGQGFSNVYAECRPAAEVCPAVSGIVTTCTDLSATAPGTITCKIVDAKPECDCNGDKKFLFDGTSPVAYSNNVYGYCE